MGIITRSFGVCHSAYVLYTQFYLYMDLPMIVFMWRGMWQKKAHSPPSTRRALTQLPTNFISLVLIFP